MTQINGTNFPETRQEITKTYSVGSNICAKMEKNPQLDFLKNINEIK